MKAGQPDPQTGSEAKIRRFSAQPGKRLLARWRKRAIESPELTCLIRDRESAWSQSRHLLSRETRFSQAPGVLTNQHITHETSYTAPIHRRGAAEQN